MNGPFNLVLPSGNKSLFPEVSFLLLNFLSSYPGLFFGPSPPSAS